MRKIFSSFKTRVFISFGITLGAGLLIGGMSFFVLGNTEIANTSKLLDYEKGVINSERLRYLMEHIVATSRTYLLTGDQIYLKKMQETRTRLDDLLKELDRKNLSSEEHSLVSIIQGEDSSYRSAMNSLVDLRSKSSDTSSIIGQLEFYVAPKRERLDQAITTFVHHEESLIATGEKNSQHANAQIKKLIQIIAVIALSLAFTLAFLLARILLKLYDEAQRATRLRDDLLAVVSHDLKNPISAARLSADLILRTELADDDSIQVKDKAISIRRALDRAISLIGGLLDLNKLEANHLTLDKGFFDINSLTEESIAIAQPLGEAKKIALTSSVQKNISVQCDRERIMQVIGNLLGNAIKFTPDGGCVTLRASQFNSNLVVSVQDSGSGISGEDLPHIFDRYWQAKATAKKGSGLGLAIAKGFVEAHGGKIWVESKPNMGSIFFFAIPLGTGTSKSAIDPSLLRQNQGIS